MLRHCAFVTFLGALSIPQCLGLHTLLLALQVDWRDKRHWRCNNNVHPSRHGTYAGITMHPFETVSGVHVYRKEATGALCKAVHVLRTHTAAGREVPHLLHD